MGSWGVRSYENDEAGDALDAGFEQVHGDLYEDLMDDANPLTPDQIHARLANPETLAAAIGALDDSVQLPWEEWDEVERLGYVGVVVRHAELGVALPEDSRDRAIRWLKDESIEWDEATKRRLRRDREVEILDSAPRA